jgi:hypothetical protein
VIHRYGNDEGGEAAPSDAGGKPMHLRSHLYASTIGPGDPPVREMTNGRRSPFRCRGQTNAPEIAISMHLFIGRTCSLVRAMTKGGEAAPSDAGDEPMYLRSSISMHLFMGRTCSPVREMTKGGGAAPSDAGGEPMHQRLSISMHLSLLP